MVFGIFSSSSRSDVSSDDNDENATIESESSSDDTHAQKKQSILRRKYGRRNVVLTPKKFERKVSWSHTIESRQDYYHVKEDESTTFESIADNDYRSSGESQTEIDSGIFSSGTTSSAQSSCTSSHDDNATSAASSASTSDQTSYSQDDDNTSAVVVDDSLRSMITSESSNSIEVEHKVPTPPPPSPAPPMMGPTLTERKQLQYRSNLLCASISISEATFDKYKGTGNDDKH